MRVLLIESVPGQASVVESELRANGHDVVSCRDEGGGPCRGVAHHRDCPLDAPVDLTLVARTPAASRLLTEMGAVCATRHRVPVVEFDPADPADDIPDLTVTAALGRRRVEAGYAAAVYHELAGRDVDVDIERTGDRVAVRLTVEETSPLTIGSLADRARHALREYDPHIGTIDVTVVSR